MKLHIPLRLLSAGVLLLLQSASGASDAPSIASDMHWRMIGPFRGGRTVAISGVVQQTNVFYIAPNNGGVWKTTDYGMTWKPIFDGQPTGSIGSIAVAPSNPDVIYLGSGEGLQRPDLSVGDGIYKSVDGGRTWLHLGLRDGYQIPSIVVDPRKPDRIFVSVLGHPYGPNTERGIFRSIDGGQTFQRVLYKDENTGGIQVALDPGNSQIVYAALWAARQAPWEVGASFNGPGSGLFKSEDGGNHWRPIGNGLPSIEQGLGRIGFTIARSNTHRLYAIADAQPASTGLFRSDDGGESWTKTNSENRIVGRAGDFAGIQIDPTNEDLIYVANTSTYRSEDAGKTFHAMKGAPGGDDYHTIWINPDNPKIIFLGVDQGATISVNGGQTWSSWYNQPTAQFYHVITDNQFPYWVYGAQQESGSIGIASRSDYGSISFRNWQTVGVEEYGYVAPDPLHPNLIYGGKATRFNKLTGDVQDISPQPLRGEHRFVRTMPLLFSPIDPHTLFLASEVLFKTMNGGESWETISPDLTRKESATPDVIRAFVARDPEHGQHRGVIYTVAPSPRDANLIWVGNDDGLVHITRNGGREWLDVTPPALTPWSKVSLLEASHFATGTAFAAINRFRLDDLEPHVLRTRDYGKTWTSTTDGLPVGAVVNAVREDPKRPGLLYAGTEIGVFVSFDEGDHWQTLQQNLPITSIRDLVIHENDLVVATHGRSFWILDDVTPLRQVGSGGQRETGGTRLFIPETAVRWRWNRNTDTPLPPEEPVGQNPPDGAIIDFALGSTAQHVSLDILAGDGKLIRRFSSDDKPTVTLPELDQTLNIPTYWVRPDLIFPRTAGSHRFVWDLRSSPPASLDHDYPIAAIRGNTPRAPVGTLVTPGRYSVRLTVDGKAFSQPLTVVMDPRVDTTPAGLKRQFTSSSEVALMMDESYALLSTTKGLESAIAKAHDLASSQDLKTSLQRATETLATLTGQSGKTSHDTAGPTLRSLNGELARIFEVLQSTDCAPTTQALSAVSMLKAQLNLKKKAWQAFQDGRLPLLNDQLRRAHLPELSISRASLSEITTDTKDGDQP